jgi:hypothetical protein
VIVARVNCLAAVQGFSAWKGLANLVLSGLIFGGIVLVIVVFVLSLDAAG